MLALIQHGARRPTAMVADTVEVQHARHPWRTCARLGEARAEACRIEVGIGIVVREVGQHLAAVRRLPPEELQRQLVCVVPMHLLRDEVVDAGTLIDLRQLPVVAEGVRVPADLGRDAVELLELGLTDKQLAHLALAIGQVQVGLNPHATHDFPAAFLYALRDLVVQHGVFVGHPIAVRSGGLRERIGRILAHQLRRAGEGTLHHVDRLGRRPEPGGIDMRVAREVEVRGLEQRPQCFQLGLCCLQRGVECHLVRSVESVEVDRTQS